MTDVTGSKGRKKAIFITSSLYGKIAFFLT